MSPSSDENQKNNSGQGRWMNRSRAQEDVQLLRQLGLPQPGHGGAQDADISRVFARKSAWFSTSVDNATKQLWNDHGGIETDFDRAEFIFSADNTSPDTLSVFSSTPYIMEHLAVFHSQYIRDTVRGRNRSGSQVVLGHYILPPDDILNDVRKHVRLGWDFPSHENQLSRRDGTLVDVHSSPRPQNTHRNSRDASSSRSPGVSQTHRLRPHPKATDAHDEDVVHISLLRKVKAGTVHDFVPTKNGAEVYYKAVR